MLATRHTEHSIGEGTRQPWRDTIRYVTFPEKYKTHEGSRDPARGGPVGPPQRPPYHYPEGDPPLGYRFTFLSRLASCLCFTWNVCCSLVYVSSLRVPADDASGRNASITASVFHVEQPETQAQVTSVVSPQCKTNAYARSKTRATSHASHADRPCVRPTSSRGAAVLRLRCADGARHRRTP